MNHMHLRRPVIILMLCFALMPALSRPGLLAALDARCTSVETYLTLYRDGKAVVRHSIVWNVSSGTMGGFYFQGEEAPFVWDTEHSWADLPQKVRVPLEIKRSGDKWDIT
ncbi:MAG: hypothetical protein N3A02_07320, partial [Rectinema sp.]|nr:hypothetical protein [Rectinema sp.]